MKNKMLMAIAFTVVLVTGFEFSVQPATATSIEADQLGQSQNEIHEAVILHEEEERKGKRRSGARR